MSAATILVKIIGALFKIPLFAIFKAHDETAAAVTYFTSAYAIFSMLLVVSTAGLPVAVSRMVSTANAKGRRKDVLAIFSVARATFLWAGGISSVLLFIFAPMVATWMNASTLTIRAIAPAVFLVCLMCPYRGVHQGHGNMMPTAISQVVEAAGKLVIGLGLALLMVQTLNPDNAAAGGILGVTLGSLLGALFLIWGWRKHKHSYTHRTQDSAPARSRRSILGELLRIAIPITVAASILQLANVIDMAVALGQLRSLFDLSKVWANVMYAPLGETQPIVGFPQALVLAMAVSIIPALSAAVARREKSKVVGLIEQSLHITALLALPCTLGLVALGTPVMQFLYTDGVKGGHLMAIAALNVLPICLVSLTNAILQALGRFNVPLVNMLIGGVARIVATVVLIPLFGLTGAAISPIVCYGLISLLNIVAIGRMIPLRRLLRPFAKPLIASMIMGASVYFFFRLTLAVLPNALASRMQTAVCMGASVLVGVVVYAVLVLMMGVVKRADVARLPKGDKLANFLHLTDGTAAKRSPIRTLSLLALSVTVVGVVGMATLKPVSDYIPKTLNVVQSESIVSAGDDYVVAVGKDGKLLYAGPQQPEATAVWDDLAAVAAGKRHVVGLKKDGTVVAAGDNSLGQCDVGDWRNIKAVVATDSYTVGLKNDGGVVATKGAPPMYEAVWHSVQTLSAGPEHVVGLRKDGTLCAVGNPAGNRCGVGEWSRAISLVTGDDWTAVLTDDGKVLATNQPNALNVEDMKLRALVGDDRTLMGLTYEDSLTFVGVGSERPGFSADVVAKWSDIKRVAMGKNFIVVVTREGNAVEANGDAAIVETVKTWKGKLLS